ncbi:MAG TPA: alkaline phosphatase family protein [Verrucomicrobiae bacterium]|nr:alkaline phosphatase family protein [Verrucomicrobiae bacterium]
MPPGIDQLKHIVVLMMENRSFDHMFGYLKQQDQRIDGLTGNETNPDTTGALAPVNNQAAYQAQLQPDPGHHFEDVKLQIYGDVPGGPAMQGFVKAYYEKQNDVAHSRLIMNCFAPAKIPVITTLGRKFLIFNRWFSSLPGPTVPNRAFAHFGTSFGHTDMDVFYLGTKYPTIYQRMLNAGRTAKIYYYDQTSATIGMAFILKNQPQIFATFSQFQEDCDKGNLPDYSFIEPNYSDHDVGSGRLLAADQHPDHNVLAGDQFIAAVYMSILNNEELWNSTLLLINYDEHGGMYDHVEPPACTPDEFQDPTTGFAFDRLGIRVPAVLVSPWIPEATVISDRTFDHASIPATVTKKFIGDYAARSPRELAADTFLDFLTLPQPRQDYIAFQSGGGLFGGMPPKPGHTIVPTLTPPASAAQPDRKISQLLFDQVNSMHKVEMTLPAQQQTHIDITQITTEAQAADYISKVMAVLKP